MMMSAKRKWIFSIYNLAITAGVIVFSCALSKISRAEDMAAACNAPGASAQPYDLIFRGKVLNAGTKSSSNSPVSFVVLNLYKGNAGDLIKVQYDSQSFTVGKHYLVFLRRNSAQKEEIYSLGTCGEARPIADSDLVPQRSEFTGGVLDGDLSNANFTDANLKNVDFSKSVVHGARFNNADLSGADFSNTSLIGTSFSLPAALVHASDPPTGDGVDLTGARFDETTLWPTGFLPFSKGGVLVNGRQKRDDPPLVTDIMQRPDIKGMTRIPKLSLQHQGTYLVDGVHIGHYNDISAENGAPDLIKVYIAGLIGRTFVYNNTVDAFKDLRIEGDPGLDTVLLDGCFTWEWPEGTSASGGSKDLGNNKYASLTLYPYVAPASSGAQVHILIQSGLKVAFSKNCYHAPTSASDSVQGVEQPKKDDSALTAPNAANLAGLKDEVSFLEQYWAHHPPSLINLPPRPASEGNCMAGELIFNKAGRYPVDIPPTCTHIIVKEWGGGAGGTNGGTGGFSMGLIDIPPGAKLEAVVGKSGNHDPVDGKDTELLINGSPVLVAGGGKLAKQGEVHGFPGGGRNKDDLLDTPSMLYYNTDDGALGATPEYGITLWSNADSKDPYYGAFVGSFADGEIVFIWPAPTPQQFLASTIAAGADVLKTMQPRQEAVGPDGRITIIDSAYIDNHCKYDVSIVGFSVNPAGQRVVKSDCLENTVPIQYKPKANENIAAYEKFIAVLQQKQQAQQQQQQEMIKQQQEMLKQMQMYRDQPGIAEQLKFFQNQFGAAGQTNGSLQPSPPDLLSPLVKLMKEGKLPTEFVHHESHDYKLTNDVYVVAPLDLEKHAVINAHYATISIKPTFRAPEEVDIFESGWGTYMVRDNSCDALDKGKPIYTLSPLSHTGVKPTMNLIKTDYQYPYPYTNFIVFGRGVSPNDIITQGNQIIDTKTKDSIQFTSKPCVNIIFSEQ